jgi:hypothetical protein
LFSPTYEEIIFFTCRLSSSIHRPKPSAPALLETMVRLRTPDRRTSGVRLSGFPLRAKPPDMMVMPSRSMPSRVSLGAAYTSRQNDRLFPGEIPESA